jgi:hypothetical protein
MLPAVPVSTLILPIAIMAFLKFAANVGKKEFAFTNPEVEGSDCNSWSEVRSPLLTLKFK